MSFYTVYNVWLNFMTLLWKVNFSLSPIHLTFLTDIKQGWNQLVAGMGGTRAGWGPSRWGSWAGVAKQHTYVLQWCLILIVNSVGWWDALGLVKHTSHCVCVCVGVTGSDFGAYAWLLAPYSLITLPLAASWLSWVRSLLPSHSPAIMFLPHNLLTTDCSLQTQEPNKPFLL